MKSIKQMLRLSIQEIEWELSEVERTYGEEIRAHFVSQLIDLVHGKVVAYGK